MSVAELCFYFVWFSLCFALGWLLGRLARGDDWLCVLTGHQWNLWRRRKYDPSRDAWQWQRCCEHCGAHEERE